jgi:hypothetical protein
MAIAVTCFGEVHCDGHPVRRIPVSLLEPAFIGIALLARISAPRDHSLQLGGVTRIHTRQQFTSRTPPTI